MSGCSIAKHAGWRLHGCIACISNNSATIVMARRAKQNQEQDQIPAALAHIARTKAHIARTKAHHDTDIAQTDAHYSSHPHELEAAQKISELPGNFAISPSGSDTAKVEDNMLVFSIKCSFPHTDFSVWEAALDAALFAKPPKLLLRWGGEVLAMVAWLRLTGAVSLSWICVLLMNTERADPTRPASMQQGQHEAACQCSHSKEQILVTQQQLAYWQIACEI
ncbi:hypothetical protein MMC14_010159 [Varicellaria rhodocarpa]|nr:hypothetical protein [Varicellaria rhodocarpa]